MFEKPDLISYRCRRLVICDPAQLTELLPKFFSLTKYDFFRRRLSKLGFKRDRSFRGSLQNYQTLRKAFSKQKPIGYIHAGPGDEIAHLEQQFTTCGMARMAGCDCPWLLGLSKENTSAPLQEPEPESVGDDTEKICTCTHYLCKQCGLFDGLDADMGDELPDATDDDAVNKWINES